MSFHDAHCSLCGVTFDQQADGKSPRCPGCRELACADPVVIPEIVIQRKAKTPRSRPYLDYIRAKNCLACDRAEPSQAAHVRGGNGGGMGLKPSDYRTVPLCYLCHAEQHRIGEAVFWKDMITLPDDAILELLSDWLRRQRLTKEMIAALEAVADRTGRDG